MKTPPTEPGIYLHLSVNPFDSGPSKKGAYIYKVSEKGHFWHPVHMTRGEIRGSFFRIPEELHEAAWAEAKEVFVEEKAKWIISFRSGWDRDRHLGDVAEEFRGAVEARLVELNPSWRRGE